MSVPPTPYRITAIAGKGSGLFATRPIPTGELIIAEKPLFIASSGPSINQAVEALSESHKAIFYDLVDTHNPESPTANGIFLTNAVTSGVRSDMGGIYEIICRVNHSCTPNSHWAWSESTGCQTVYAATDISEGEEISTAYVPITRSRERRQKDIFTTFNFTCACPPCSGELDAESDARRERIDELDKPSPDTDYIADLRNMKERLRLMDKEGIWDLAGRSADFFDAARIATACCDDDRAKGYIGRAYAHRLLCAGPESGPVKFLHEIYRNPSKMLAQRIPRSPMDLPSICDRCGTEEMGRDMTGEAGAMDCEKCHGMEYCSRRCWTADTLQHRAVCEILRGI